MDPYGILTPPGAPIMPAGAMVAPPGPPLGILSPAQPAAPARAAAPQTAMSPMALVPGSSLNLTPDLIQRVLAEMAQQQQQQRPQQQPAPVAAAPLMPSGAVPPATPENIMLARRMLGIGGITGPR